MKKNMYFYCYLAEICYLCTLFLVLKHNMMTSAIEIKRVENKRDLETFIQFRYDLYRGDK